MENITDLFGRHNYFSRMFEEHICRLDEVFSRLCKAGLKLKPSKCDLFQHEVLYLGHIITSDGIKANPEKLVAVKEWATPTNVKHVRSFMGLCSYYRRFIKGFSHIARPLNRLLESGVKFEWTDECEHAFNELKSALTIDNVMAYPLDDGKFILDTDASDYGMGATLSQMQFNEARKGFEERPISFASKSLTKTQRNAAALLRHSTRTASHRDNRRHYLLRREFVIRSDHSALRWKMSFREPTQQMARWLEILSQFNFKLEHRSGRCHSNADALSRVPCSPEECDCYDGDAVLSSLPCRGCSRCTKQYAAWSNFIDLEDVATHSTRRIASSNSPNKSSEGLIAHVTMTTTLHHRYHLASATQNQTPRLRANHICRTLDLQFCMCSLPFTCYSLLFQAYLKVFVKQ